MSVLVSHPSNLRISWHDIILAGWRGWSANLARQGKKDQSSDQRFKVQSLKILSAKSAAASHMEYTRGKKNAEPAQGPRIWFITPGCGLFSSLAPSTAVLPTYSLPCYDLDDHTDRIIYFSHVRITSFLTFISIPSVLR